MLDFIDTTAKKRLMFIFFMYVPIISMVAGAPIPMPQFSIFTPSAEQIAILNFTSLLVTLVGAIIGVGFYLERRQNQKLEQHKEVMDDIDNKLDESTIATNEHIKILRSDMHDMESRICSSMTDKTKSIEKTIEEKTAMAKMLEDERIKNIHERLKRIEDNKK